MTGTPGKRGRRARLVKKAPESKIRKELPVPRSSREAKGGVKDRDRRRIEEIIGRIQCPKNAECVTMGLENLCKAKDIGLESLLLCLELNPLRCKFALALGKTYFCKCPLRMYLARKLEKIG